MATSIVNLCQPSTFSPSLFGGEILNVDARLVSNFTASAPAKYRHVAPTVELDNVTFCNVTVTYTHPGQGDVINVEAWLPTSNWKGVLQAQGGGGFIAGRDAGAHAAMAGALYDGFVGISTDSGVNTDNDPTKWALKSPGNLDWSTMQDFASITLNDMAIIGKAVVKDFYGKEPDHSYFIGCSQGGRQAMMLAQRYPDAFNGIIAGAPGINWNEVIFNTHWPTQFMNELKEYPPACEFDAITAAAIDFCDPLDGVTDGIIARSDECLAKFNPLDVVGKRIVCKQKQNSTVTVSHAAAKIVNATWRGIETEEGQLLWYGLGPGADLTGSDPRTKNGFLVGTNCTTDPCKSKPFPLGPLWIELFVAKGDPDLDVPGFDRSAYIEWLKKSRQEFFSIMGTSDPDLSKFRKAGGKLLSWHGQVDTLLPWKNTEGYFNSVANTIPSTDEFFRFFAIPGLGHCEAGRSNLPESLYRQLRDWVEKGDAPEYTNVTITIGNDKTESRIVCAHPSVARFDKSCGDTGDGKCWSCEEA